MSQSELGADGLWYFVTCQYNMTICALNVFCIEAYKNEDIWYSVRLSGREPRADLIQEVAHICLENLNSIKKQQHHLSY